MNGGEERKVNGGKVRRENGEEKERERRRREGHVRDERKRMSEGREKRSRMRSGKDVTRKVARPRPRKSENMESGNAKRWNGEKVNQNDGGINVLFCFTI